MLTVCHLAEKPQNINRNTENHDHKRGITSIKLALKERSPTVASIVSTISSHTQPLSLHFREENSGGRGSSFRYRPRPTREHYFSSRNAGPK